MPVKRAIVLVAASAVTAALLLSCASTKVEPKWEGRKIDEAIAEYGPPTRVMPSGTNKLYVWEFRHQQVARNRIGGGGITISGWVRSMTVDANGIITSHVRQDL